MGNSQDRWVDQNVKASKGELRRDIRSFYLVQDQIGEKGTFGVVRRCIHKKTQKLYAVKLINKYPRMYEGTYPREWLLQLQEELEVMKMFNHEHIAKLHDSFEDKLFLYIVMEILEGGELYDRVTGQKPYAEGLARVAFNQIALGVKAMHEKKVAHCDLKPDNFLFLTSSDDSTLKIIDFGHSQRLSNFKSVEGELLDYPFAIQQSCFYNAPEILDRKFCLASDIWSLGICLFMCMVGHPPFLASEASHPAASKRVLKRKIREGFDPSMFPKELSISDGAKDLVARMLVLEPKKRLTIGEVLQHPWLSEVKVLMAPGIGIADSKGEPDEDESSDISAPLPAIPEVGGRTGRRSTTVAATPPPKKPPSQPKHRRHQRSKTSQHLERERVTSQ